MIVDRRLLITLLAIMGALCAGAVVIGIVAVHNTHRIEAAEHQTCLSRHVATIQSNSRVETLNLLQATVVAANRKAERTLKGYSVSPLVVKLERHPPAHAIPVPQC